MFRIRDDQPLEVSYDIAELDFDTVFWMINIVLQDYYIENPVTARKATKHRVLKMESKIASEINEKW